MMVPHIEIVTVLTIILFAYPILVYAMKNQILTGLKFSKITKVFNKAIVPQIPNAIILGVVAFILNKTVYTNGHGTIVTEIVAGTAMTYITVGGFFYIPGLIMINIINWIVHVAMKNG
jgi:hypothetical protein